MRRLVLAAGSLRRGRTELEESVAHYARDVLRLEVGAEVHLYDGEGRTAIGTVLASKRREVILDVGEPTETPKPSGPEIVVIQAVAKGDKMDAVVRQCTELGISALWPVLTARSIARQDGRRDRWLTIAEDAMRVSSRAWRPEIAEVRSLPEILKLPRAERSIALALEDGADLRTVLDAESIPNRIEVLIGPEGGLEPDEIEAAKEAGFTIAHLGPHTLRTETAGPAIVAMLRFWARAF
jgi:16S rRNA (uracil1498-N3)-methyltransferase